jgi:hypothetical protein
VSVMRHVLAFCQQTNDKSTQELSDGQKMGRAGTDRLFLEAYLPMGQMNSWGAAASSCFCSSADASYSRGGRHTLAVDARRPCICVRRPTANRRTTKRQ